MNIPCPNQFSECAPCTEFPFLNTSAELPDSDPFIGVYNQAPTHGTFFAPACQGFCESTDSQQDADNCAAAHAADCSLDGAPSDGNPLWSLTRQRFGNTLQQCAKECPDETCEQTAMVAPGTVVSFTQADADARAASLACQQAEDKLICFLTTALPQGNVDSAYSAQIVTFGGTHTPVFSVVAGALPTGLHLNSATGFITGTPTVAGSYSFTVMLTTP